jgi:hypothetical protein
LQLGDAVMKLEEELIKLIKVTGSALLKDATPDDLALMSQQPNSSSASNDANSEFSRLQRMPGYDGSFYLLSNLMCVTDIFFHFALATLDSSDSSFST